MEEVLYQEYARLTAHHWWFVGRRRLLRHWLSKTLPAGPRQGCPVLDVGCGVGDNYGLLKAHGPVVGADRSRHSLLHGLDSPALAIQCDLDALPFKAGSFGVIAAFEVVEHMKDDVAFLRGLHALLKPGGWLALSVPAYMALWGPHDELAHHQRRYTPATLKRALQQAGFEVLDQRGMNWILLPLMWLHRLIQRRLCKGGPPASDFALSGRAGLNALLKALFMLEIPLLPLRLPFGATLLVLARKSP